MTPGKDMAETIVATGGYKDDTARPALQNTTSAFAQNANKSGAAGANTPEKRTFDTISVSPGQNKASTIIAAHPDKPPTLNKKERALLDKFIPEHAPIMGDRIPDMNKPVRVRALLLSPKKWLERNREGYMKYVSDEMFNIVMDGLERSPYFEFLEPTIVPDHRLKKEFVLEEQEDTVRVVDSRNLAPKSYSAYSV